MVEAYHSIYMLEHYHGPLRQVYSIIISQIPGIQPDLVLQMAFKAINTSVGLNRLVLILLVFDTYPQIIEQDASSLSII